jgi:hypothetical protein
VAGRSLHRDEVAAGSDEAAGVEVAQVVKLHADHSGVAVRLAPPTPAVWRTRHPGKA